MATIPPPATPASRVLKRATTTGSIGVASSLGNLETSAFVATRASDAQRIRDNLLAFPAELPFTVFDPTGGEGDLLGPYRMYDRAWLGMVEISAERAAVAQTKLASRCVIKVADVETAHITPHSVGLVASNPPYMWLSGQRLEYRISRWCMAALQTPPDTTDTASVLYHIPGGSDTFVSPGGGVFFAILPARSAIDGHLAAMLHRHLHTIRCWRLDDDEFAKYTQVVIVGYRRSQPLSDTEMADRRPIERIKGWAWDAKMGTWKNSGNIAPPLLPDRPLADPYLVPPLVTIPVLRAGKTTAEDLVRGLQRGGAHDHDRWQRMLHWNPVFAIAQPLMTPTGESYIAALILCGALNYQHIQSPDGVPHVLAAYVSSEFKPVEITDKERTDKGYIAAEKKEDHAVIRTVNLRTGETALYRGGEVYRFLAPWLPSLANQVLGMVEPLYTLDPADWELDTIARIGWHKQLHGAEFPGLADPQVHMVCAMGRALDTKGHVALQADPGTGKTLQTIALAARQADAWRHRHHRYTRHTRPAWITGLARSWRDNPILQASCREQGIDGSAPRALPVLVTTPFRVVPGWSKEISGYVDMDVVNQTRDTLTAGWPAAEVILIHDHTDIRRWLLRCCVSDAPAVIAIASHSLKSASAVAWQPAVIARTVMVEVMDEEANETTPSDTTDPDAAPVTRLEEQTHFFCPDCAGQIVAVPGTERERAERASAEDEHVIADVRVPVTSLTYFTKDRRRCPHCPATLWTVCKIPARERKYPQTSFADWSDAQTLGTARMSAAAAGVEPITSAARNTLRSMARMLTRWAITQPDASLAAERAALAVAVATAAVVRPDVEETGPTRIIDAFGLRDVACPDSFSVFRYLLDVFPGCCALAAIDESHNAKERGSDMRQAMHWLSNASQSRVWLSGTHFGGRMDDFFHYLWLLSPAFWPRLGYGYEDADRAHRDFGSVKHITRERRSDARKGSGGVDISHSIVPCEGISARLLPHLLGELLFLTIADVGAYLPPREELPVGVSLAQPELHERLQAAITAQTCAEQAVAAQRAELACVADDDLEAWAVATERLEYLEGEVMATQATVETERAWVAVRDIAAHYREVEQQLEDLSQRRVGAATLQKGTLPGLWTITGMVADKPHTLQRFERGPWGDILSTEEIFRAPILHWQHVYPLERELLTILAAERAEERVCLIGVTQTTERSTAQRLTWVLGDRYRVYVLPEMDADERERAIQGAVAEGAEVVIAPWAQLTEGLNLQCLDTIINFEQCKNLFTMNQFNQRHWRLGATTLKRSYYLYYRGTTAEQKVASLALRNAAAQLFGGSTPQGALVESVGGDQLMLAQLGKTVAATEELDLKAAFRQRNAELAETLKTGPHYLGTVNTLPERLRAIRLALVGRSAETVVEPVTTIVADPVVETIPDTPSVWTSINVFARGGKGKRSSSTTPILLAEQFTLFDV